MQYFGGWPSNPTSTEPDAEEGKSGDGSTSDSSWTSGSWFTEAQKDPWMPSLSRKQRVMGFITCLLAGAFCFLVAFLLLPVLVLKARKFAVLYTLGTVFSIGSFAFLWGPYSLLKHLATPSVLPYSGMCAVNMAATLYCGLKLHSTILTIFFSALQILSVIYFVLSYIPGGTTGLNFMGKMVGKAATSAVGAMM